MADHVDTSRDRLEDEASALRSQLARTLESLHRRRHVVVEPPAKVARLRVPAALIWAGPLLVVGTTGLWAYRARHRRRRLWPQRMQALVRFWQHPEHVARPPRGSFGAEIARGVVASLFTFVVTKLCERTLLATFPQLRAIIAPPHKAP